MLYSKLTKIGIIATVYIGGLMAANQSFLRRSSSDSTVPVVIGSLMPSGASTGTFWLSSAPAAAEAYAVAEADTHLRGRSKGRALVTPFGDQRGGRWTQSLVIVPES